MVDEKTVSLADIINTLVDEWKIIVSATLCILFGALIFLLISNPVYKVNALVQLDQQSKDMASQLAPIESVLAGALLSSGGEIEVIRSRSVVSRAVDDLHMDITVYAKRLFFVGTIVSAMNREAKEPVTPWFGMASYGWGGEDITISYLELPRALWAEPLTLEVVSADRYKLYDVNDKVLMQGKLGERVNGDGFGIQVDMLKARPKTQFVVIKNSRYDTVTELREQLEIEELGNQTGVIEIGYRGKNPVFVAAVANAVVDEYVRQNEENNALEAKRTLDFIAAYQPGHLQALERAETALSDFRVAHGTVAIEEEMKVLLDREVGTQAEIEKLELERQDLRRVYSSDHSAIKTLDAKIIELENGLKKIATKMKLMPKIQQELLALTRDVDVNTQMYTYLMGRIQELKLMEAGNAGDVRIIDRAEPPFDPAYPVQSVVIIVALFVGVVLGVLIAIVKISFRYGVKSADEIERQLDTTVYASIPLSKGYIDTGSQEVSHGDCAIEELRSFTVSLGLVSNDSACKSVVITGAGPHAGKSFIAANTARLLANVKHKVLLIDADMRAGHLYDEFSIQQAPGLSEVLNEKIKVSDAVHRLGDSLFFLSSGEYAENPTALLMSPTFKNLMSKWETVFDFIVIDTPPVLLASDAMVVSQLAEDTYFVVKAEEDGADVIAAAFARYKNSGQIIKGCILNGVDPNSLVFSGLISNSPYGYPGNAERS